MPETIIKQNEFFGVQADGAVVFTQKGREELGPMLLEIGVKLDDVRLKSQLDIAIDRYVSSAIRSFIEH
jgi:hypothetical protein